MRGQPIPADFWRLQLDTLKSHADGLVLWSQPVPWDETAPWWQATKQFLQSH